MSASDLTLDSSDACGVDLPLGFSNTPVVRLPEMALGQAFAWCAALRRVLDRQQPFVLVDAGTLGVGSEADQQIRRCWVKRHAAALSTYCYGLIAIEPQVERRSRTRTTAIASMAGASLRVLTVSSEGLAHQLAGVLLKAEASVGGAAVSASAKSSASNAAAAASNATAGH